MKVKRERKTVLIAGLVFTFVLSFIIMGFTASSASAAEPIVLSMAPSASPGPPAEGQTTVFINQMKLLEKNTNGRLKIEIYWSQSLAQGRELVTATQKGICDIGVLAPYREPGKIPLCGIGQQPGIGDHMWPRARAYWDVINEGPVRSELDQYGLYPITLALISDSALISNKPIRSIADLKGQKIAAGGVNGETIKMLGGVPVSIMPTDEYGVLQKGTITGIVLPWSAVNDFRFYEVGKYFINFQFGCRIGPTVVNGDTWKKLPADIQKVINDAWLDMINIAYEDYIKGDVKAKKVMEENNVQIFEPSDADKAEAKKVQAVLVNKWAEDLENKGLQAKKVLADYSTLVEKYGKENPYK